MGEPPDVLFVCHFRQVPKGKGIARWTEFVRRPALHQVHTTLNEVPAARLPSVVPGKKASASIELQTEVVAATLSK